jgi:hypothetical protein
MGVQELSIKAISDAVINIRTSKLPDPKVIGNAGSFFKNPVISAAQFEILKLKFPEIVSYPSGNDYKLAAGWLIEQCGWKGFREGDAGVHKNQALVLVNYGHATGKQLYDLSQKVMDSVEEKFGVRLEREVRSALLVRYLQHQRNTFAFFLCVLCAFASIQPSPRASSTPPRIPATICQPPQVLPSTIPDIEWRVVQTPWPCGDHHTS